jgi:small subunit ribosomal protein S20
VRSEVKTKVVKARRTLQETPVAESDRYAIALDAMRALDRAASKGVLHRRNAARRKGRLARQLVKVAGSAVPSAAAGQVKKSAAAGAGKKGAAPAAAKGPDKKAKK